MVGFVDMEEVVRKANAEWERDAGLRAEFRTREAYVAWRKADARGQIKVLRPGRVDSARSKADMAKFSPS